MVTEVFNDRILLFFYLYSVSFIHGYTSTEYMISILHKFILPNMIKHKHIT